ncbi:MAG: zinc-binding dehydrogenase [Solirubrobacterales bacterium]
MSANADVMVQHGTRDLRETAIPLPKLGDGAALLRVEACGLCGSDIESLRGEDWATFPRVMGHEIVGTIEKIASGGRPDCKVGDRVAVDPWIPCGGCRYCLAGMGQFCSRNPFENSRLACYGYITTDNEPGLWGGYSSHVYIHPKAVVYPVPQSVDPLEAALWQPMAAGIQWGVVTPQLAVGATIAILGCGQRGLTATLAAREAGAGTIIVTGLGKDARKLALARDFGADHAIDVEQDDLRERVNHITGGEGVDVVLDTSSFSIQPVVDSISLVRQGGTIVFAGLKAKEVDGFPVDEAIMKGIRMQGVLGMTPESYRRSIALIASKRVPIAQMRTHVFDYHEGMRAVDTLSGKIEGEDAINVVLSNEA